MSTFERVLAAVTDGRAANGRYRQKQLQALHAALREAVASIKNTLQSTSRANPAEVEAEFYYTLSEVKSFYDSIDFSTELKTEYNVARGADNAERRKPAGLVVIRPTAHTRFFSIIVPIAAALSSGNCVILELRDSALPIDSVITEILLSALDNDIIAVSQTAVPEDVLAKSILVDQTSASKDTNFKINQLVSRQQARTIAIVDRTADIEAAARSIVAARYAFGGLSPYAPDLVFVNEFLKPQFIEECSRFATRAFARSQGTAIVSPEEDAAIKQTKEAVKSAEGQKKIRTFGNTEFLLVDLLDRDIPLAASKITGRYLAITSTSSITDVAFSQPQETLLAAYLFAEPVAAKFLSQYLDSETTFANNIPAHLLIGPVAPTSQFRSLQHRYTPEMFTISRPEYITPPSGTLAKIEQLILEGDVSIAKTVQAESLQPLKSDGQGKGHAIGFFEQGILTGLGLTASIVLPTVLYGVYFIGRHAFELFKQRHSDL